MKKGLLTLALFTGFFYSHGQVSYTVIEPASIAGGYDFTSNGDGTNWGLPNLDNPADAVMDTLALVDDGTPGLNAQGIPFANEGCNPLPAGSLAGKIAVVYRYDGVSSNVCWYGTKVLNAQNAGAIGVIMINREDALIDVPGTTDGPLTSIPFAFISKSDGAILREKMDNGEDVIAFIGNKTGLYTNDIGIKREATVSPLIAATASQISQNNTEFGFDVGTTVYNHGSLTQNNILITASVNGPGGTWTESSGPYSILSGDTLDVYTGGSNHIPAFSLPSYPVGRYTLTYNVTQDSVDQSDYDNSISYEFVISDSMIAYCSLDPITNLPVSNANYRPANSPSTFQSCLAFRNPNASRLGALGLHFSAVTGYNSGVSLEGEEMGLTLYQWNDNFTDLNDPNLGFTDLNAVAYGFYYYPSDLQDSTVFGEFDTPIQLVDNQRYLACVQPNNSEIYMGYDTRIDYTRSVETTLQPITPNNGDNGFFALGFGTDLTPSLALQVFDAAELTLSESSKDEVLLYPNPVSYLLTIQLKNPSSEKIYIYNSIGELVLESNMNGNALRTINTNELAPGIYTIKVIGDVIFRDQFIKTVN